MAGARLLSAYLWLALASAAYAQSISQIQWPTVHAAPPVAFQGAAKDWLPAFRVALNTLPEGAVVALCLSQPQVLGLPAKDASTLQALTSASYAQMAREPLFQSVPSALPYCFSHEKPRHGLATIYMPKGCHARSPCVVFLHGYGGSFLWNLYALVEAWPDHIIICPAYGMSCGLVPRAYLQEAVQAAEKHLGFEVRTPALVGLSAGGFGAFMIYAERPRDWRKMLCLAAYGREPALARITRDMDLCFMAGAEEYFVRDGSFERGVQFAESRGARVESFAVPQSGHFFLLEKKEIVNPVLRRWLAEPPDAGDAGSPSRALSR